MPRRFPTIWASLWGRRAGVKAVGIFDLRSGRFDFFHAVFIVPTAGYDYGEDEALSWELAGWI